MTAEKSITTTPIPATPAKPAPTSTPPPNENKATTANEGGEQTMEALKEELLLIKREHNRKCTEVFKLRKELRNTHEDHERALADARRSVAAWKQRVDVGWQVGLHSLHSFTHSH